MANNFNYHVRLKLRNPYDPYLAGATPLLTMLLYACGYSETGGGRSPFLPISANPIPQAQPTTALSGRVYDGPVEGARVYVDVNNNGRQDAGDILVGTSDAMGRYTGRVPSAHADKPLLAVLDGATDRGDPDNPNDDRPVYGTWRAPQGSAIISPLTELQVQTETQINGLLELPTHIDVTQYDPYSSEHRGSQQAQQVIEAGMLVAQYFDSRPANTALNQIGSIDQAPTSINLRLTTHALNLGPTGAGRKMGVLEIEDDGLGINTPSLTRGGDIFEFRQNAEGVWELWLRAGLTIDESQTDIDIDYRVTSTGAVKRHAEFAVTVIRPVEINIYENHPLTKPIYDAGDGGTFALTEGYGDNALFRITTDGRIWWRASPDYETPQDGTAGGTGINARDNIYQIEITHTASNNEITTTRLAVQVADIVREIDTSSANSRAETILPYISIHAYDIDYAQIPGELTPYLIVGRSWIVPDTGPLIITWSLSASNLLFLNARSTLNTQADIETARAKVETALAEYEAAANLKFIEVIRDDNRQTSDFEFVFMYNRANPYDLGGWANYPGDASPTYIWFHALSVGNVPDYIVTHETAHALGFKHIAEEVRNWPGHPSLGGSSISIVSNAEAARVLQPADITALQFLYGAPGTPEHQLLALVSEPLRLFDAFNNEVHFFDANENIATDTVLLTPADLTIVRYDQVPEDRITYSLPAGQFDNDLFTIDADDNEIRFKRSPDYENPHDRAGGAPYSGNNVYELLLFRDFPIIGGDSFRDDYESIVIIVKDVEEPTDASTQLDII